MVILLIKISYHIIQLFLFLKYYFHNCYLSIFISVTCNVIGSFNSTLTSLYSDTYFLFAFKSPNCHFYPSINSYSLLLNISALSAENLNKVFPPNKK